MTMTLSPWASPSSSVIVGVIVYMPACVYVWVPSQVRPCVSNDSVAPSSHTTEQVWVSLLPGSVYATLMVTGSPTRNSCQGVGVRMPLSPSAGPDRSTGPCRRTCGGTFLTCTTALSLTEAFAPSFAVNVTVNVPSSVQVT